MKGKQLGIILILLVVLGGVALLLSRRQEATWRSTASSSGGKILEFPLNDVSQVTIESGGAELNLVKKEDVWTVRERADYPADFTKVSTLIRKLWELRPVQDVKIGASQLPRLELSEPSPEGTSGTLVDLKGAGDKRLAALLLGKKHLRGSDQPSGETGGIATGRYVMSQDGSNRVFLTSETFDEAQTKPEQWLNRDFFKVENAKLITVAGTTPTANWSLARDTASSPWKLVDAKPGEELDNAKATSAANLFASASFIDVLAPDAPAAETGFDKPSNARFETFDNFVYELRIGKLVGENYPVVVSVKAELPKERTPTADEKPEDKARLDQEFQTKQAQLSEKLAKEQNLPQRPYLMAKSTIEQLVKDRSALMVEKKASPSPSPAPGGAASPAPAKGASPAKASATSPSPGKRPK